LKPIRLAILAFVILLTNACTTVQPPPDIEMAELGLTPVASVRANSKTYGAFTKNMQLEEAKEGRLSDAAKTARRRQRHEIDAVLADRPEARALAVAALKAEEQTAKENEKKLDALLGVGFGMGATITFNVNDDRVASAEIVGDEKRVRVSKVENVVPRMLLEAHYLFTTNPFVKTAKTKSGVTFNVEKAQRERCENDASECPTIAAGPFVGFQQNGDGTSFDSLALGIAMGFRPTQRAGVAIGIGAMFDRSAKTLGEGITPGEPLPTGETVVRFKETSQVNPILSVSFTF
jgi:hypothetical protein